MQDADWRHFDFDRLSFAWGEPESRAYLKWLPEDFKVEEKMAFELSGEGEHLWCWVEKIGQNSDWVATKLADWAGISKRNVGMAGQKDRHARTQQWFSLNLAGRPDPDLANFREEGVRILKMQRHQRKLQKGALQGNRFCLRLRAFEGDRAEIEKRLEKIGNEGVPNYFGEQRFGHAGKNLLQAQKMLAGKRFRMSPNQKSLYLSSLRSWMFNVYLSRRVSEGSWNRLVAGDKLQLQGSQRWFVDDGSEDLEQRVTDLDLHPTGPLYGEEGASDTSTPSGVLEQETARLFQDWIDGMQQWRLKGDRRSLRLWPENLQYRWLEGEPVAGLSETEAALPVLEVVFDLPAGSFATMVVREMTALKRVRETN
ncbi:tRNA pseudouridine(13) synthase TruD [Thiomicrorhabdus sp.]|uniref:tRNA pseudouridine(13) synthase TruD n=1 Tax=Thiomicrorhabdus sp. TaxID=2039724 RepID=UPI0029C82118|nr:tRNA pseudouridine(13) synthase TruD [Thiomicrorhabdus sp.]